MQLKKIGIIIGGGAETPPPYMPTLGPALNNFVKNGPYVPNFKAEIILYKLNIFFKKSKTTKSYYLVGVRAYFKKKSNFGENSMLSLWVP